MLLPIGEVAARSGMSPDTLRFYEREGLIPPQARDSSGRRRYAENVLDQLGIIASLRDAGFSLSDVRQLLAAKRPGTTAAERLDAAKQALKDLDEVIRRKEAALADARALISAWRAEIDEHEHG
ncbi:MAG: MerR family transcriptional regulator [Propionibacteriaceae bacterium]